MISQHPLGGPNEITRVFISKAAGSVSVVHRRVELRCLDYARKAPELQNKAKKIMTDMFSNFSIVSA